MTLRAIEDLTDAFEATKAFLTPVDTRRWAKLTFVVFFLWGTVGSGTPSSDTSDGGGAGAPGTSPDTEVSFGFGQGFSTTVPIEEFGSLSDDLVAAILALAAVGLFLGIAYLFVGSVMEFVFVESLRSQAVSVRAYWGEHRSLGVRLFAFRVAFLLVAAALLFGLFALVVLPFFLDLGAAPFVPIALLVLLPVLLGIGLGAALITEFTTVFVVPIMLLEDRGVLAGWRRLWRIIRREPGEFLAYAGLKFVLSIVAGALVGAVIAIPAIVVFLPVSVLGGVLVFGGDSSLLGILAVGALGMVTFVVLLALTAVVQVPVVTYFRYYALLLLGDVDPDVDLIPDQRVAIRDDEPGDGSDADGSRDAGEGGSGPEDRGDDVEGVGPEGDDAGGGGLGGCGGASR
jgi:hypothetical protein